jgi:2,3,4,5-tetrahydropyridine-2-carboxylate N-succinyltransferase
MTPRPTTKKKAPKGPGIEELKFMVDSAWERRTMLTPDELEGSTRPTVERVIDGIESAEFRVAEPDGKGGWKVNEWLKKAVLLYFRTQQMELIEADPAPFWDKVPARFADFDESQFRKLGARSEVVEGVIVGHHSVIGMGAFLGQSTRIYNRATGEVSYGYVPPGSVVVSGQLPAKDGSHSLYCAVIVKQVDAKTRSKTSINDLLRGLAE